MSLREGTPEFRAALDDWITREPHDQRRGRHDVTSPRPEVRTLEDELAEADRRYDRKYDR